MIDISKLDKADVLRVLYNNARPQGMGYLHFVPGDMSKEEARLIIKSGQTYFDYLKGRVMKVNLSGSTFDPWLYDRDNGYEAAANAIADITEEL